MIVYYVASWWVDTNLGVSEYLVTILEHMAEHVVMQVLSKQAQEVDYKSGNFNFTAQSDHSHKNIKCKQLQSQVNGNV